MKRNLGDYDLSVEEGHLSDMNAAKDDGTDISANTVGEIAEVELGESDAGPFSAYYIAALGGFPDERLQTRQARIEGTLVSDNDADADGNPDATAAGTRVRLRVTDKNRERTFDKTRWYNKSEVEASNIENLPFLKFGSATEADWFKEGRVLVLEAKNPSSSFNIAVANSSLDFPFVGGA